MLTGGEILIDYFNLGFLDVTKTPALVIYYVE
jgi:hypothetical protein